MKKSEEIDNVFLNAKKDFFSIAVKIDLSNNVTTIQSLSLPLVVPVTIVVTALLLLIWMSLKYLPFMKSNIKPTNEENGIETKVDLAEAEDSLLPDWLRERKEMIFPENTVVKGEQLGKGQFGVVLKGALVQGKAVYVKIETETIFFMSFFYKLKMNFSIALFSVFPLR